MKYHCEEILCAIIVYGFRLEEVVRELSQVKFLQRRLNQGSYEGYLMELLPKLGIRCLVEKLLHASELWWVRYREMRITEDEAVTDEALDGKSTKSKQIHSSNVCFLESKVAHWLSTVLESQKYALFNKSTLEV